MISTAAKKMLNNSGNSAHPCRSPCLTSDQSTDAAMRLNTSSHPIVELFDSCCHLRWYSDASEYLPREGAVDGVVRLLEIYEAHEKRHPAFRPIYCSELITNIMSVVGRSG